jgi:hypothetical protein
MNIDLADGVLTLFLFLLQTIMITMKDDSYFFGIESQQKMNIQRVVVAFYKEQCVWILARAAR